MEIDDAFLLGLDRYDAVARAVPDAAWEHPSPCAGWTARDVHGHVVAMVEAGNAILAGQPPPPLAEGPPGAHVAADAVGRWASAAAGAHAALRDVDLERVVDTPGGPRAMRDGLAFPAMDLHLHACDVGIAAGVDVELEPEVIEMVYALVEPMPREVVRSPGVFGTEQPEPTDATPTERLLAWTGRRLRP